MRIQSYTILKFYQRGVEGYECFYNVYFSCRDVIFNVANEIGGIMKEIIGEIPDQKVFKEMFHVTKEDCERMQKVREALQRQRERDNLLHVKILVQKKLQSMQETK